MNTQDDGENTNVDNRSSDYDSEIKVKQYILESIGFVGIGAFDPVSFYQEHYAHLDFDNAK